jgi:hypothetical protein
LGRWTWSLLLAPAILLAAAAFAKQDGIQDLRLGPPSGALEEEFTRIVAVRELSDGRVLLAHRYHPTPLLGDFSTGGITEVGRGGAGPGEYKEVRAIFPLGSDSSLVDDQQNSRWSLLDGTKFARSATTWRVGWYGPRLVGADRFGGVLEVRPSQYGTQPGVRVNEIPPNAESLLVIRHHRSSTPGTAVQRSDTLLRIRGAFRGVRRLQRMTDFGRGGRIGAWYELRNILASEDQAIVFPDGWIAIAYQDPYRVEWRSPEGAWRRGQPLPFVRVPADEQQKRAAVARNWPRPPQLFSPDDYPSWPRVLPPFLDNALLALPDGRLAVKRTPDARSPGTVYDLVDRQGRLTARLRLAANESVAAFSSAWAYVIVRDSDDLDWLHRHTWPPPTAAPGSR